MWYWPPCWLRLVPSSCERVSISVLIVDDQQPFRVAARDVIAAVDDFHVAGEAASGEQAVEMAARLQPDLVLMDIHLPGIDGFEASSRIRRQCPTTVVILLSASEPRRDQRESLATGWHAQAYLPKASFQPGLLKEIWDAARLQ